MVPSAENRVGLSWLYGGASGLPTHHVDRSYWSARLGTIS